MKTQSFARSMKASPFTGWLLALVALVAIAPALRAVPEPSTVLYGLVSIDGVAVDATRNDVTVEARRAGGGVLITSYTMGSSPQLGNFYRLSLPMESTRPTNSPATSIIGDSVDVVVRENGIVKGQATYLIPSRGAIQRVDIGTANSDLDGNGLPDLWETTWFGAAGQNPSALVAGRNRSLLQTYLDGSNPSDTNSVFGVSVLRGGGGQTLVSFVAKKAEGVGYEGKTRLFSVEATTNLGSGWSGIAGYTNVVGNNQTVTFTLPATNAPHFFRGKAWLE